MLSKRTKDEALADMESPEYQEMITNELVKFQEGLKAALKKGATMEGLIAISEAQIKALQDMRDFMASLDKDGNGDYGKYRQILVENTHRLIERTLED